MRTQPKAKFKEGQIVFSLTRKQFGKIELVQFMQNKGYLHTILYIKDRKTTTKENEYARYYEDRMEQEFITMKNTDMAYILFGDK